MLTRGELHALRQRDLRGPDDPPHQQRESETHHNRHRPHRSLDSAAPLKPLPEPVDLEQYRIRKQTRAGGVINEYHLIA